MFEVNQTKVMEILLLGFQNTWTVNCFLFVLFLVIYILTLVGNLLIIILVAQFQVLQSPMYFFITQLSVCDILLTTNTVPNMLHIIINGGSTISLSGCITQFYFFCVTEATECFILTVMSCDRYLAICRPLRYTSIMTFQFCFQLILISWLLSCILTLILVHQVAALQFCGHVIDHYFCDLIPLLKLSCTKHTLVELIDFILAIPFVSMPFFFILCTYVYIFITILGISSNTGRQKAFSTCSAHLTVVVAYYGSLISVYMAPSKVQSYNINKVLFLLYTVLCPFFNPIIYSLRNEDIKISLNKFILSSLGMI
ncbi:olfactory receptor 11L1-like [Spea bombifrons]|uniref:olfactory receptor 11L1-like n=1 Tax=Spea bombifrons TaxID=233779 RepID=UPI00234C00BA|nr:olfactory receptor 11L1-like [Spea bombifrons]